VLLQSEPSDCTHLLQASLGRHFEELASHSQYLPPLSLPSLSQLSFVFLLLQRSTQLSGIAYDIPTSIKYVMIDKKFLDIKYFLVILRPYLSSISFILKLI